LGPSRLNNKLSAYAQLIGAFDYNATPLAPPGTQVLVHEAPKERKSWDPHGVDGWYVGPAMKHYRCFRCYIPTTNSERIAETVDFFPKHVKLPSTSSRDAATKAAKDLIYAIKNPTPSSPTLQLGDETIRALERLAEIFFKNLKPTTAIVPAQPRVETTTIVQAAPNQNTSITPAQPRVNIPQILAIPPPPKLPKPNIPPLLQPTPTAIAKSRSNNLRTSKRSKRRNFKYPVVQYLIEKYSTINSHVANPVIDPNTGASLEFRHLIKGESK